MNSSAVPHQSTSASGWCEHCCFQAAVGASPLIASIREAFFLACQSLQLIPEYFAAKKLLSAKSASLRSRIHRPNDPMCEHCLHGLVSSGNMVVDEIREWAYVVGQLIGQLALGLVTLLFGIGMILSWLTPNGDGGATRAADDPEARARQAEGDARKAEEDARRQQEADEHRRKHNTDVEKLNQDATPLLDHSDALEDDKLVSELNHTAKAVAQGKEDPETLRKIRQELIATREKTNQRDQKRQQKLNAMKDKEAARSRILANADSMRKDGKRDEAEGLYKQADSLLAEADALFGEYRSI